VTDTFKRTLRHPWVMRQIWTDVLFAHWPVPQAALRPHVPELFEIDRYDGEVWLGIVPFDLALFRVRGLPPLPGLKRFPEVNVRTYVTVGGRPGVYFLSLDAASLAAVLGARLFFRLPYHCARMSVTRAHGAVVYESRRRAGGAAFRATYSAIGPVFTAASGSLDEWLVERYCLYTNAFGARLRLDIDHAPWRLQHARAQLDENTLTAEAGIPLRGEPRLHVAARQEMVGGLPYPCG
jgi:uncharacterized protein